MFLCLFCFIDMYSYVFEVTMGKADEDKKRCISVSSMYYLPLDACR